MNEDKKDELHKYLVACALSLDYAEVQMRDGNSEAAFKEIADAKATLQAAIKSLLDCS